jgi:hypothetical protein
MAEQKPIHIKKSKEGSFKAACDRRGQSMSECKKSVLAKNSKASPALKKKAQFAKNAAGWSHKRKDQR